MYTLFAIVLLFGAGLGLFWFIDDRRVRRLRKDYRAGKPVPRQTNEVEDVQKTQNEMMTEQSFYDVSAAG